MEVMTAGLRAIDSFHQCYRSEKRATGLNEMVAPISKRCYAGARPIGFPPAEVEGRVAQASALRQGVCPGCLPHSAAVRPAGLTPLPTHPAKTSAGLGTVHEFTNLGETGRDPTTKRVKSPLLTLVNAHDVSGPAATHIGPLTATVTPHTPPSRHRPHHS